MKIAQLHQHFQRSSGICTDTRKITEGCLFFALKGDNFDGNDFAQDALDQGAYKVIIDDLRRHKNTGETILCGNSLKLLQKLASYHRNYLKIPVIGLTGSNGKTTTKELIHAVLSKKYKTTATEGNLNNHIGVPLTLLSFTTDTEIGVVEMGANHLKEIGQLTQIAQPDFGYITNFGKAHLEGFGSIDGVIQGKSELYAYLKEHDKPVFVNANDNKQKELTQGMKRISFGNDEQDHYIKLKDAQPTVLVEYKEQAIKSHLIGIYNFHNIAAAIAIGAHFDVPSEKIKQAIQEYIPTMNRSQLVEKNGHTIILDAYNANPSSMMAAVENFQQTDRENKLLILGDMFELGEEAAAEHQFIASYLCTHSIGKTLLIGENFFQTETNDPKVERLMLFVDLAAYLQKNTLEPSLILIKGSRGMALERVLEYL